MKENVYRCDGAQCVVKGEPLVITSPPGSAPVGWRTLTLSLRVPSERAAAGRGEERPKAQAFLHLCPLCPVPADPGAAFRLLRATEVAASAKGKLPVDRRST